MGEGGGRWGKVGGGAEVGDKRRGSLLELRGSESSRFLWVRTVLAVEELAAGSDPLRKRVLGYDRI